MQAQTAPQPRADLARGHAVTPSMLPSSRQVPQPPKPVGPSSQSAQPPQPAAAASPPEASLSFAICSIEHSISYFLVIKQTPDFALLDSLCCFLWLTGLKRVSK